MSLSSFLHRLRSRWLGTRGKRSAKARRRALPMSLETLEDRRLLAVLPPAIVDNTRTALNFTGTIRESADDSVAFELFGFGRTGGNAPTIAADPLNPSRLVAVYSVAPQTVAGRSWESPGGLGIIWSIDQGQTWRNTFLTQDGNVLGAAYIPAAHFDPDPGTSTNPDVPLLPPRATGRLPLISNPSVAFDRDHNFFITYTEHDSGQLFGYVMFQGFNFSIAEIGPQRQTPQNVPMVRDQVLYNWALADAAFNPVVAIDTNLGGDLLDPVTGQPQIDPVTGLRRFITYVDPTTGQRQSDPNPNEAIYVAWNTATGPIPVGAPLSQATSSNIKIAASVDKGFSFTNEVYLNDDPIYRVALGEFNRDSNPQIAFSQQTADGRLPGGLMTVVWSESPNLTVSATPPPSQIHVETMQTPDIAPQVLIVDNLPGPKPQYPRDNNGQSIPNRDPDELNGFGVVDDAIVNAAGNHVTVTSTFFADVNLDSFPDDFDTLADLDVTVALRHPNTDSLLVNLIDPNGRVYNLFLNHLDNGGNVIPLQGLEPGAGSVNVGVFPGIGVERTPARGGSHVLGTVFDEQALRPIDDRSNGFNADTHPFIGHYGTELGSLSDPALLNSRPNALVGKWRLEIQDNRRNGPFNNALIANQFLDGWNLRFTSRVQNQLGFGIGQNTLFPGGAVINSDNVAVANAVPAAQDGSNTYPLRPAANPNQGIGPGAVVAIDNTLGSYSAYQGRIYIAYTGTGRIDQVTNPTTNPADNTDIFLIYSDDGGATWGPRIETINPVTGLISYPLVPKRVNDDTVFDNFSEGNRPQFQPAIAVDPVTGTLVVSYFDARRDAARARSVVSLMTSLDGGASFSAPQTLNASKSVIDAVTRQTISLESIPVNVPQATTVNNVDGVGSQQGLFVFGGRVVPIWGGNANGTFSFPTLADTFIGAGPRITGSTQGPITNPVPVDQHGIPGQLYGNLAGDGTRQVDGFQINFDRPIDPSTLLAADIRVLFRTPNQAANQPPTDLSNQVGQLTPLDPSIKPTLNIGDALVVEGNFGNPVASFLVQLGFPMIRDITIRYETSDGTAVAGTDYRRSTGTFTIPAGATIGRLSIPVIPDGRAEGNETFRVTLFDGTDQVVLDRRQGTAFLIDDDSAPLFTVGDVSVLEGTGGTTTAFFSVYLSSASTLPLTVRYSTSEGTAGVLTDFTPVSGVLTFAPGETIRTIPITINTDATPEANESFNVDIFGAVGANLGRSRGIASIIDDDSLQLSVGDVTVIEGNDPGLPKLAVFTVTLTSATTFDVSFDYGTSDGTAVAPADYATANGRLTIPTGATQATFSVQIAGNTVAQPNRVFSVRISNPTRGAALRRDLGIGTIVDDDAANIGATLTVSDAQAVEGDPVLTAGGNSMTFTVSLPYPVATDVTVAYTTVDGTAISNIDYRAINGTLTFSAALGETVRTLVVNTVPDRTGEGNRSFFMNLSNPVGAVLGKASAMGTVIDDDGLPTITVTDAFTSENNTAQIFVSLSSTSLRTITVAYTTNDGLAVQATDYVPVTGTLTFLPGEIAQAVVLQTRRDSDFESNEDFFFDLSNATNAVLVRNRSVITVMDDGPGIFIGDAAVRETDAGRVFATFVLSLDRPAPTDILLNYTTVDVSATANSDYVPMSGQLRIDQGRASTLLIVPVNGDRALENNENFLVRLSNPSQGIILRAEGSGLIVDDDLPGPSISVGDAAGIEGGFATFQVLLGFPSLVTETVDYDLLSGSATRGIDFTVPAAPRTLVFLPGETTKVVTVPLDVIGGTEGLENFYFQLSNSTARLARDRGVGVIGDQRPGSLTLGINDSLQVERDGNLDFRIVLTQPAPEALTVRYNTVNDSATSFDDFVGVQGSVIIPRNATGVSIPVSLLANGREEPNARMFLAIQSVTSASNTPLTILRDRAAGYILDSDVRIFVDDNADFEGSGGTPSIPYSVHLDRPVPNFRPATVAGGRGVTVTLATRNGTATDGSNNTDIDFQPFPIRQVFVPFGAIVSNATFGGQRAAVDITGDNTAEPNQFFFLDYVTSSLGQVDKATGSILIIDDDTGGTETTVGPAVVTENLLTGTPSLSFTLFVRNPPLGGVGVTYATAAGSAVADLDYTPVAGTVNVTTARGGRVVVPLLGNTVREALGAGTRNFSVNINNVSTGTIGITATGGGGSASIYDDEQFPTISVADGVLTEDDAGLTFLVFDVALSTPARFPVSFRFRTEDGSALAGADYVIPANNLVTIGVGQTRGQIRVRVLGDLTPESVENFFVNLFDEAGGRLTRSRATGTIQDDDTLSVSIGDATVVETDTGTTREVTFTAYLSGVSATPVTVSYTTASKDATSPADYATQTGVVTFAPLTTTALIVVTVNGDNLAERDEQFVVNLSNSNGAGIDRGQALGIIVDNDTFGISVSDLAVAEGSGGSNSVTFTVFLQNPVNFDVTVTYATADGTATAANGDYTPRSGTIVIPAGTTTSTIIVPVNGDQLPEQNEAFFVNLLTTDRGNIVRGTGTGLIVNDDATVPNISVSDATVLEGGAATFSLFLNFPASEDIVVTYTTLDGSGIAGRDYQARTGTVTIPLGQLSASFSVPTIDNILLDGNRTFRVSVNSNQLNTLRGIGTATVVDNDSLTLSVGDVSVVEGNEGSTVATFTVFLTAATDRDVTFRYRTTGGTAMATEDYLPDLNLVTIPAGATSATFSIVVLSNEDPQPNRSIEVTIDQVVGVAQERTTATATIIDDDATASVTPGLSLGDVTTRESTGQATFTVFLNRAAAQPITVEYLTSDGTALAGTDYIAAQGAVLVPAGATSATFTIDLRDDTVVEGPENFRVTLTNPAGANLVRDRATATILDDDVTPFVTVGSAVVREGSVGTTPVTVTLLLNRSSTQPVVVGYSTGNGTALAGSDFATTSGNVTFAPGTTTATAVINVVGDTFIEGAENFFVNVTGSSGGPGSVRGGSGTVTIIDDETPTPSLTVNNGLVKEGDTGITNAEFTVSLSNVHNVDVTFQFTTNSLPLLTLGDVTLSEGNVGQKDAVFTVYMSSASNRDVTVDYATGDGTAVAGLDYVTVPTGTVRIPAGQTSATFRIPIIGNATVEQNRTFFVNLSNPVNAGVQRGQAMALIVDDDALRISLGDAVVREGDPGTTTRATFTVFLNAPSPFDNPVTVQFVSPFPAIPANPTNTVVIPGGATSATFQIGIPGNGTGAPPTDPNFDTNRTFQVTLANPSVGVLERAVGTLLIVDDDNFVPRITIGDVTVHEGGIATTGEVEFPIFMLQGFDRTVTVDFTTADGSAIAGTHYTARSGTVTFAPGQTQTSVRIPLMGNAAVDGNRRFFLNLSNASNGINIVRASGAGTIIDDDIAPPFVTAGDVTVQKSGTGLTPASFPVFLSTPSNQVVSVRYTTVDGNVASGFDYVATSGTITFAPGQTVATVTVPVIGASVSQLLNQTFFLRLTTANNGVIRRDTGAATVTTSAAALLGEDFLPTTGTATIPAGQTSTVVRVPIIGDRLLEPNESLFLNITGSTNSFIVRDRGTAVIVDDEASPIAVSIGDVTSFEGTVGTFNIYLNRGAPLPVTVSVSTLDGTGLAGVDYESASQFVTFLPGETIKTFNVSFLDNARADGNRTFSVNLDSVSGANFDRSQGFGVIVDNDQAPAGVSIADVTFTESSPVDTFRGIRGTTDFDVVRQTVFFTVFLSQPNTQNVAVDVETIDGTATAGKDYVSTKTTVIIPAGLTTSSFTVDILGDTLSEGFENFTVRLSNARTQVTSTPVPIVDGEGTGTIVDDDRLDGPTRYLVRFAPQSQVGTYSYSVDTDVSDRIRSTDQSRGPVNATRPNGLNGDLYQSTDVPKLISGSQTSTTFSRIIVPQQPFGTQIADVNVNLNITHTRTSDLIITLIAPDNTRTLLFDGRQVFFGYFGPNVNSLENTTFDDEARQLLDARTSTGLTLAPFTGSFHPGRALGGLPFEDTLSKLIGKDPTGVWTLQIDDVANPNAGSLDRWSLDIVTNNFTLTPGDRRFPRAPGNSLGNFVDQDADGVTAEKDFDAFSAPRSRSGIPLDAGSGFTDDTFPLLVPGPQVVQIKATGQTTGTEALFLNRPADGVDVVFDRDMVASSFTVEDVLSLIGPQGNIPLTRIRVDAQGRPVLGSDGLPIMDPTISIVANPPGTAPELAQRTFRIVLPINPATATTPAQPALVNSGYYSLVLRPEIVSTAGDALDIDQDAGLDNLRGGGQVAGTQTIGVTVRNTVQLPLLPNQQSESTITLNDPFLIESLTLQLNIAHNFVPDLSAELIGPDNTVVRLFTNVGFEANRPVIANFSNTVFDDTAVTPVTLTPRLIAQGRAPFDVGAFRPQTPLADLRSKASRGTYRLRITNRSIRPNVPAIGGTLLSWGLTFQKPVTGNGLGEPAGDTVTVPFRVFTQDPTNPLTRQVWTAVGPASQDRNGVRISGRITALAVDPSDASGNTVYVGAASGGIWKTTNFLTQDANGPTYIPLTDLGPRNGLQVSSLTVIPRNGDPRQSYVIATTGEGDINGSDPQYGFRRSSGVGLLRSLDAGLSWEVLDSARNYSAGVRLPIANRQFEFVGMTAFRVLADPVVRNDGRYTIYAAFSSPGNTNQGIWRSDDTGETWIQLRGGDATDIQLALGSRGTDGNVQVLFGAFRGEGVFLSQNRGVDWRLLTGTDPLTGLPNGNPQIQNIEVPAGQREQPVPVDAPTDTPNGAKGRITLAVPALFNETLRDSFYQGWLYAVVSTAAGGLDGLYLTKDFGKNWTKVRIPRLNVGAVPRNLFDYTDSGFASNDESVAKPDHDLLQGVVVNGVNVFNDGNDTQSIVVDPKNPNVVYVGGTDQRQRQPAGGLIRVDTTGIVDSHAFYAFNESDPDGGLIEVNTVGGVTANPNTPGIYKRDPFTNDFPTDSNGNRLPPTDRNGYLNLFRDPANPFDANSSVAVTNVGRFGNDGSDVRVWQPFNEVLQGVSGVHRMLALPDPQTGGTRLFIGTDEGVFSGVDNGQGVYQKTVGLQGAVSFGSRNGNLQTAQFNDGATQPSVLAAEIGQALFYGSAKDTGFPRSAPNILQTGNLLWTGPQGSGDGAAVDQTGTGTLYQFRYPCCGDDILASDFFQVQVGTNPSIARTNRLVEQSDNINSNAGQWPLRGGAKFAVNPINPNAVAISGRRSGRVYRTINQGLEWFVIADPAAVGGAYAPAVAFGAPDPQADVNNRDNFIYVGNVNGQLFVTTTGGGSTGGANAWTNITGAVGTATGLDGSAITAISTDPRRGSKALYVATQRGVYFNANSLAGTPTWVNITGTLFATNRAYSFGANGEFHDQNRFAAIGEITTMIADWRFDLPDARGTHPVLYVGTDGGVFRSDNRGVAWRLFPAVGDGAPRDGGFLPNVRINELELTSGNIDPATGKPDGAFGFNLLVAHTYGRGTWVIRADVNSIPGPRVVGVTPTVAPAGTRSIDVVFSGAVDPSTFSLADVFNFTGPTGALTPLSVTDVTTAVPGQPNPHNVYRIAFNALTADGVYRMSIGPNISDYGGNLMDQNGNGINGETTATATRPSDIFTFSFVINTTDNGRFLNQTYTDVFNRGPDLAGFNFWLASLDNPRFALLPGLARALLFDPNPENPTGERARAQLIRDLYSSTRTPLSYLGIGDLLGREANPSEVDFWLSYLRAGNKPEQLIFGIVSSDEYFQQNRTGHVVAGTIDGFVQAMVRDLFSRDATAEELVRFGGFLQTADTGARLGVLGNIIGNTEYYRNLIDDQYNRYLARPATVEEEAAALAAFRAGRTQEQLTASLLGSDDYFLRHPTVLGIAGPGTNETFVKAVYQELFPGDVVTDAEVQGWITRFAQGTSREDMVNELLVSDRARFNLTYGSIATLYRNLLDREAQPSDIAVWQARYAAQPTLRVERIQTEIVASPEYVALKRAGATNGRDANINWIDGVFNDLVGRTTGATSDEQNAALTAVDTAVRTARLGLVQSVVVSQEFIDRLVVRAYTNFLGRQVLPAELGGFWRPFLASASLPNQLSPVEGMIAGIFGSREYFDRQVDTDGLHSNQSWVRSVFFNLRLQTDQAGQTSTLDFILNNYRPQRVAVANAFVFSSEARNLFIADQYQTLLGRRPATNPMDEGAFWQGLFANGLRLEQMTAAIIGSGEFFNRSATIVGATGGSTNTTFVQAAYLVTLKVLPTPAEVQAALDRLAAGTPRTTIATELVTGDRFRFDATNGLVTTLYQRYLRRPASAGDIAYYRGLYAAGIRTENLIVDLIASSEYFL